MSALDTTTPPGARPPAGLRPGGATRWLVAIVALGLGVRLADWGWGQAYAYFCQGDGVAAYSVAVDFGQGDPRAWYLGQPTYNEHAKLPGPLYAAFCWLGLRLLGSVEGASLLVLLLNTVVIWLTYRLTASACGAKPALLAALFAATFPWVVFYSVGLYNADVMAFLGSWLYLVAWRVMNRERSRAVFGVPLVLLTMLQFHMSGLMLVLAVALLLWLCPVRINWPWLVAGMVAGLVLYLPYLLGDRAHDWTNTRGMFTGSGRYSFEGLKALSAPLSFLVNWAPRWTRSVAEYREMGRACFGTFGVFLAVNALSAVFAGFLVVGVFLEIRQAARGFWSSPRAVFARSPGRLFCAILVLVPLLLAAVAGRPFHTRYCLVLLPPMLGLVAVGAMRWLAAPRVRRWFVPLLVVTTCANVWFMLAMSHHQGWSIAHGPRFIPSFRKLESVYQLLKTHAGPARAVQVDDADYLASLPRDDRYLRDAALIREYVRIREKEASATHPSPGPAAVYRLTTQASVSQGDSALAYGAHGIALVRVPSPP